MVGDWDGNGLTLLISALLRLKAAAPACTTESPAWTRLIIGSFFCGHWSGICPNLHDRRGASKGGGVRTVSKAILGFEGSSSHGRLRLQVPLNKNHALAEVVEFPFP